MKTDIHSPSPLALWIAVAALCAALPVEGQKPRDEEFAAAVADVLKRDPQIVIDAINSYQAEKQRKERLEEWRNAFAAPADIDLSNAPLIGPINARWTIVEVADFECRFCASAQESLKAVLGRYKGQIRLAFLHLPLPNHPNARLAALAAWAASRQGRFFEYQERLFALEGNIQPAVLATIADDLKLDLPAFERDRGSPEAVAAIDSDVAQAKRAGILGTPSFIVNGIVVRGALSGTTFEDLTKFLSSPERNTR